MAPDPTARPETALYRLMTWLSPSFPVGAYTYSHGIEYAVEAGLVTDRDTLARWLGDVVLHGAGGADAILVGIAWDAVTTGDDEGLALVSAYAEAFRGTAEMALESRAQGRAFLGALRRAWPHPKLDAWMADLARAERLPAYPVAVGVAAALAGIRRDPTVTAYLHAFATNLVSAGVRLVPLGQTDGVSVLASLEAPVHAAASDARGRALDDIGTATVMADWTSMQHETQYTRLYRS